MQKVFTIRVRQYWTMDQAVQDLIAKMKVEVIGTTDLTRLIIFGITNK